MNDDEFNNWKTRLPREGQEYVARVRTLPPARRPQNRGGMNVVGAFPSKKMKVAINFESHRNELSAIYLHEHDDDVVAYYDQPEEIKLTYPDAKGRNTGFWHTPDFLVLRKDGAALQEWKPEEKLVEQPI